MFSLILDYNIIDPILLQNLFKSRIRNCIMELNDPLIQSVLIYMYRHPGGVDLEELVGKDQYDEVIECLLRHGMIENVG